MNKYQELNELCSKMIQQRVKDRSESCQQILKDKHLWTLSENEFNFKEELRVFCKNCDKEYKNSFTFWLMIYLFPPIFHIYVKCDECNAYPIVGTRYKCNDCEEYDLCESCIERKDINHLESHTFREINK